MCVVNEGASTSEPRDGVQVATTDTLAIHPWTCWLIAFLVVGALYVSSSIPGVAWGDTGDAQLRVELGWWTDAKELSRSHPLYYFVSIGVRSLGCSAARAANLVSALCGALTVANLAAFLAILRLPRTSILSASLILALSHALWHISAGAEVMSMSTTLLTLELIIVHRWITTRSTRWLIAAAFVNGLGLSTHNMAVLTWPAYVVIFWQLRRQSDLINARLMFACLGVGIIATLPLWAILFNTVRGGLPVHTALFEMITGRYTQNVFHTSPGLSRLARMIAYSMYSFPSPLTFLLPVGVVALRRETTRTFSNFLVVALAVYFLFAVRYNVADQHVFFLHAQVLATVVLGFGINRWQQGDGWLRSRATIMVMSCTAPLVFLLVPYVLRNHFPDVPIIPKRDLRYREPYDWFLQPWRFGEDGADRFARETLDALPEDAILIVDTTVMTPILYLQQAENLRRDVHVYNGKPYQPFFEDPVIITEENLLKWITERRLCTITDVPRYLSKWIRTDRFAFEPDGCIFRVVFADKPTEPTHD